MPMQLALFDLDHTLLSGDSDYEWTQYLVSKGIVDRTTHEARNAEFYEQYKAGTMDIHEFLDFQLRPLADHTRADLEAWHADFMETQIRPRLSQKARELVRKHLDAGDICAMVTATNSFVTGPIARELGIPHLIATIPAQENGRFTGKPRGLPSFREGKIARVDSWLEALGLWWGSFAESFFYGTLTYSLPVGVSKDTFASVDNRSNRFILLIEIKYPLFFYQIL